MKNNICSKEFDLYIPCYTAQISYTYNESVREMNELEMIILTSIVYCKDKYPDYTFYDVEKMFLNDKMNIHIESSLLKNMYGQFFIRAILTNQSNEDFNSIQMKDISIPQETVEYYKTQKIFGSNKEVTTPLAKNYLINNYVTSQSKDNLIAEDEIISYVKYPASSCGLPTEEDFIQYIKKTNKNISNIQLKSIISGNFMYKKIEHCSIHITDSVLTVYTPNKELNNHLSNCSVSFIQEHILNNCFIFEDNVSTVYFEDLQDSKIEFADNNVFPSDSWIVSDNAISEKYKGISIICSNSFSITDDGIHVPVKYPCDSNSFFDDVLIYRNLLAKVKSTQTQQYFTVPLFETKDIDSNLIEEFKNTVVNIIFENLVSDEAENSEGHNLEDIYVCMYTLFCIGKRAEAFELFTKLDCDTCKNINSAVNDIPNSIQNHITKNNEWKELLTKEIIKKIDNFSEQYTYINFLNLPNQKEEELLDYASKINNYDSIFRLDDDVKDLLVNEDVKIQKLIKRVLPPFKTYEEFIQFSHLKLLSDDDYKKGFKNLDYVKKIVIDLPKESVLSPEFHEKFIKTDLFESLKMITQVKNYYSKSVEDFKKSYNAVNRLPKEIKEYIVKLCKFNIEDFKSQINDYYNKTIYIWDTNALIDCINLTHSLKFNSSKSLQIIPDVVLGELDCLKNGNEERNKKVRAVNKILAENKNIFKTLSVYNTNEKFSVDDAIIRFAQNILQDAVVSKLCTEVIIKTNDNNMRAKVNGLQIKKLKSQQIEQSKENNKNKNKKNKVEK